MLVLSRKLSEKIVIGNSITICVLRVSHDHVRIGIQAPREIAVDRFEVWTAKQDGPQNGNGETGGPP